MIFFLLLFISTVHANQDHKDGQTYAKALLQGVHETSKSTDPSTIPGFETVTPKEAMFNEDSLKQAAADASKTDEASQCIVRQAQDRQTFKIDPATDPLFTGATQAVMDPEKTLEETITETGSEEAFPDEIKICEESGDEYPQTCTRKLEIDLEVIQEKGHHSHPICHGHWKSKTKGTKKYCSGICKKSKFIVEQPKQVKVIREEWVGNCDRVDSLVDQGLCRMMSKTTSPKNETRQIKGEPVTREYFEETNHFACFKTSSKTCAGLRERGCYQTHSRCKERSGDKCVLWEQTYHCPSGKRFGQTYAKSNGANPFCLTGNCTDASYEANGEMFQVMSQLAVLREAQQDLKSQNLKDKVEIFKGKDQRCSRNCLDFKDCCGNGKGWGVSFHLTNCTPEEQQLADMRHKNRCVQVGTFCDEKVMGQCIRKITSFCCYGNKIARLIQENGRTQLGLGWGTPQKPQCEGLSPDQLSKIDFSKIDFSELFADIKAQMVSKGQSQAIADISADRLKDNMTVLTKPGVNSEAHRTLKEKGL